MEREELQGLDFHTIRGFLLSGWPSPLAEQEAQGVKAAHIRHVARS